jgi:hypothetical protein
MAAPDVVRGPDGRYYLYFNTNAQKVCRVGVSDSPVGPFTLIGVVRHADGTPYEEYKMFDPGVLVDDDGRVYLFVGFCMPGPVPERFRGMKSPFAEGSLGFELEPDMMTIRRGPVNILPGGNSTAGTGFEGHGFYEASSPRKIRDKYVMVYSAETSHEMAYALADQPLGAYAFAGVLVSNADLGLDGNTVPKMPYGNVHGGLVELHGSWYIFYHRQTSGQEASRQGCAEKLPIREDGWFGQAEITSCGLNEGALPAHGAYNACYCCHLTAPDIDPHRLDIRSCRRATEPHIYEETNAEDETKSLHYIANIGSGMIVGYKYFDFAAPKAIAMRVRGSGRHVQMRVTAHLDAPDGRTIGNAAEELNGEWQNIFLPLERVQGEHALYFAFEAGERMQFQAFTFMD